MQCCLQPRIKFEVGQHLFFQGEKSAPPAPRFPRRKDGARKEKTFPKVPILFLLGRGNYQLSIIEIAFTDKTVNGLFSKHQSSPWFKT